MQMDRFSSQTMHYPGPVVGALPDPLFSANLAVPDSAIVGIPQQPLKTEIDESPTLEETVKIIAQLKSGNAAGIDGIHRAEIYKLFELSAAGSKANHCRISAVLSS